MTTQIPAIVIRASILSSITRIVTHITAIVKAIIPIKKEWPDDKDRFFIFNLLMSTVLSMSCSL